MVPLTTVILGVDALRDAEIVIVVPCPAKNVVIVYSARLELPAETVVVADALDALLVTGKPYGLALGTPLVVPCPLVAPMV